MPAALLKARLQAAREAAAKNLREKSGDQICREYCRSVDVLLREHFRRTLAQTPRAGRFGGGVALLAPAATGGADLCLFSDLDLLFVFRRGPGGAQEDFIKRFFHSSGNVGVTVGHSTHSLDSALGLVGGNLDSTRRDGRPFSGGRTSLAGELARRLQKRLRAPAVARWYLEPLLADLQNAMKNMAVRLTCSNRTSRKEWAECATCRRALG
jgi:UTP:GlnB (protein PII) uridylyltransferase